LLVMGHTKASEVLELNDLGDNTIAGL
jgi:hypothetical protein